MVGRAGSAGMGALHGAAFHTDERRQSTRVRSLAAYFRVPLLP